MTSKTFYRCCRDLVSIRWKFSIGRNGDLRLQWSFFGADVMDLPPVRPIVAVARDVCGFDPYNGGTDSIWSPADKLSLAKEFALLIEVASISNIAVNSNVFDVRSELLESLAVGKEHKLLAVEGLRQQGFVPPEIDDDDKSESWKS